MNIFKMTDEEIIKVAKAKQRKYKMRAVGNDFGTERGKADRFIPDSATCPAGCLIGILSLGLPTSGDVTPFNAVGMREENDKEIRIVDAITDGFDHNMSDAKKPKRKGRWYMLGWNAATELRKYKPRKVVKGTKKGAGGNQ